MAKERKTKENKEETPLMKQYNAIKAKHPDALLLFRVGDFYETFGEDAVKAARTLGIVLTKRNNGSAGAMDLAGFPHHSLETYLPKLVRAGFRVAICDQLEDPKTVKGIVKRGVTELVTPGVALNDKILDNRLNNFLAAIHYGASGEIGVSFLDVSTGEFLVAQGNKAYVDKLLQGFSPSEVLYQRNLQKRFFEDFGEKMHVFRLDEWVFQKDFAFELLQRQFGTTSLKGFGVEDMEASVIAAGAALHYLSETQHDKISHITSLSRIDEDKYVWLDRFTIRNLELLYSPHEGATTLIDIIDQTVTPMGSRLLKRWVLLPLRNLEQISRRLDTVDFLVHHEEVRQQIIDELREISDLERLTSKVAVGRINPRECNYLLSSIKKINPIKEILRDSSNEVLGTFNDQLNPCQGLVDLLTRKLDQSAPVAIGKGNVIAEGVHPELDELRHLVSSGKNYLLEIQQRESEKTGIPSLKVAFNNVFGYYLEVTNTHKDKVPAEWVRKQTLTGSERYIIEELKEYETKILGAEEKILAIETRIYAEILEELAEYIPLIQHNAQIIAQLDCLSGFAGLAIRNDYVKPKMNDSLVIEISSGRHPVIERTLPVGEAYIPNDIFLDSDQQQIIMITGPNMAGKSALLRQTALIVLMAQIGCFVPAKSASIGMVDKVFTRVGASDNLSSGESTFMVEMNETASILNNISERSLILLDEIGRGTSTYDGISIAWAISEYLHENARARPKTLFATHYHELNEMERVFPRIRNFNVSVQESGKKVIFLRKLVQGGSEHSFGIHVARMAGMPSGVVRRAEEVMRGLEESQGRVEKKKDKSGQPRQQDPDFQLSFFQLDDPVLEQIREELENLDINTLTPVEALMKLNEIKKLTGG